MPLSAGNKLGPYVVTALIGAGGMGEVYRARDHKLNREVAIKVRPPALADDADYLARFQREAQTLASLNHPNIASIYGLEANSIVMELVEGDTLRGPFPLSVAETGTPMRIVPVAACRIAESSTSARSAPFFGFFCECS